VSRTTGMRVGVAANLFNYTNQTVVGPTKAGKLLKTELLRLRGLKGQWGKFNSENPALERWGEDDWEKKIWASSALNGYVDVRRMIDHWKKEGDRIFEGSTWEGKWLLDHDCLSQWFEKGAQDYMKIIGMHERQVMCLGETCKGLPAEGRRPGNMPEVNCLDDRIFKEFEESVNQHVAATYDVPRGDPSKFSKATPELLYSAWTRVWPVAATSELIIEAMDRIVPNLDKFIENKGVPKESKEGARRNGHRSIRTQVPPLHPDAVKAMAVQREQFCVE
jgi:hypothetical protein